MFLFSFVRLMMIARLQVCLYRVGSNSPIVAHLLEAAQNDIEVSSISNVSLLSFSGLNRVFLIRSLCWWN
jgi:hypothetical protein